MKHQILILSVAALMASGCMISDMASRYSQDYSTPAASDDPYTVLNAYGNWIDVPMFGRVWQPAVQADWRPYTDGQWVWTDQGWMWDSDEPFGWVVYHYGSWTQTESLGWVWIPGNDWSPARVDWYSGNDYVAWAPMAPPQAPYPGVYQTGFENYWTIVPTPQFTRLNVGAYRTVPPAPRTPLPPVRGRSTDRPPEIITIQGATHQLISPRKTERDQVRVGGRSVTRVRIPQVERPAPTTPVYVSSGAPGANQPNPPAPPVNGGGQVTPRPTAPIVVSPPPVQPRTPSPVRVTPTPAPATQSPSMPQPASVTPVPAPRTPQPIRVTPVPAPVSTPAPARVMPAPAPARVTPAPAGNAPARVPVAPPPKPAEKKDRR